MERTSSSSSSPRNREEEWLLSCWGRLKLRLPWTKRRISNSSNSANNSTTNMRQRRVGWDIMNAFNMRIRSRQQRPAGGFRYDPLSYAQNFDELCRDDDNEDGIYRGFSSRFAPPPSRSLPDHNHK